jgi:hypothetical protein
MSSVIEWLKAPMWGAPHWVWIVTLVALPILNEIVQRAKWTRAQSILQAPPRMLLRAGFGSVPILGEMLRALANEKPPQDPPEPPAMSGAAVVLVLAGLVFAATLSGCAMSDYARADLAITAQTKVASAATEAVTAWDETNQAQIVGEARAAGDTTTARAQLAADQRVLKLARATIRTFGAAIQAEAVGVELARQAKAKLDLGALLPRLLRLGRDLIKSLKDFGVSVPSIPLLSMVAPLPSLQLALLVGGAR